MDFTPDDEQIALRGLTRGLLKSYDTTVDAERRRTVASSTPGYDPSLWRRLGQTGVLGLPFAEVDGGSGAGPREVAVVAEEIGRVLAPEPYVASVVLAGGLVSAAGTAEQRSTYLAPLAEGESLLSFACANASGVAEVVLHGAASDAIVWQVADELYIAPRPDGTEPFITNDGGRAARLTFDRAAATRLGVGGDASAAIARVRALAQIAACHEAVGAMETALAMTTSYLTTRKQFGVTLNRFQALTFRASDMYADLELTRSLVTWATMVAAEADDLNELVDASSRAKLQTAGASRRIGQEAIQMHGGIGVTAEYAVGWYCSRLVTLAHWLGDASDQLRALAGRLDTYGVFDPL